MNNGNDTEVPNLYQLSDNTENCKKSSEFRGNNSASYALDRISQIVKTSNFAVDLNTSTPHIRGNSYTTTSPLS